MITPDNIGNAFEWASRSPPIYEDDIYERWENEQRDRWAVESLAIALEHERKRRGVRDALGVVSLLLAIASACLALLWGAS